MRRVTIYGITYRHRKNNYWSWLLTLLAISLVVLVSLLR